MSAFRNAAIIGMLVLATLGHAWADERPSRELQIISAQAAQGDAGAQLLYGLAYLEGRYNLKPDPEEAAYWLRRAARDGQPYAQMMLGNLYSQGKGVDRNTEQAVYWWRQAAHSNNRQAQYQLGKAYLDGEGVKKDATRAVHWLTQAAEHGDSNARYLLGKMYYEGYSVPQDKELGKDWLSQAAAQGNSAAINLLGVIGQITQYTTMVHQQSAEVLEKHAREGDAQAQYELGLRYESGAWDVTKDEKKALYWLTKAAENGNRHAMATLGHIYNRGELGVKPDPGLGAQWLSKSKAAPR